MKSKGKTKQGLTFWVSPDQKGGSRWINIIVSVEEFEDGRLKISAKYGNECIGTRDTSIDNSDIVSKHANDA